MRKFFWNGSNDQQRIPLVAWDKICNPKDAGGVGLRKWPIMNLALGAKLVWGMYDKAEQKWEKVQQNKYLNNNDPARILTIQNPLKGSAIWNFYCGMQKFSSQSHLMGYKRWG